MRFLAILFTAAYLALNIQLWRKTRSKSLLIIQFLLYFYSFHIYWIVLLHEFGSYDRNPYLFRYPYYAAVNDSLLASYLHYAMFSTIYLALILITAPTPTKQTSESRDFLIRSPSLIGLSIAGLLIVIPFWSRELGDILATGMSGYLSYKDRGGAAYPLIRMLTDLTAASLLVLLAAILKFSEQLRAKASIFLSLQKIMSVVMSAMLALMLAAFGDKSSLMFGLLFSAAIVFGGNARIRLRTLLLFPVFLVALNTITIIRHNPEGLTTLDVVEGSALNFLDSGEAVSGLSQYVLVHNDVAQIRGQSISYFFHILVPRFIAPDRPDDPYMYFARQSGMGERTGWGIHYATDCFMNFGISGLIGGAIFLGLFHGYFYRQSLQSIRGLFLFAGLVGSYPLALRAGFAGIKTNLIGIGLGWVIWRIGVVAAGRSGNLGSAVAHGGGEPSPSDINLNVDPRFLPSSAPPNI